MIRWTGAVAAAALLLALGGCSTSDDDGTGEGSATVYVSLPLPTPDGRDAADGAALALADAGGRAGDREIRAVYLDDTERIGRTRRWTPARVGANARRAIRDSTALAYLGDFDSGATRTSLPITNEARMLQVSAASSANDLVVEPATFDDVPAVQPSDERTFGRVIPSDEAQAAAAAAWAKRLGARRVAVRSDDSAFGDDLAEEFEEAAVEIGVLVRGAQDTVYLAGEDPRLLQRRRAEPPVLPSIASDALLVPAVDRDGPALHVTSAALDPAQLPPAGQDFVRRFRDEYRRRPGRYAAYGYEAMAVVLDAIERAGEGADRSDVIDAFFDTGERESVLGPYSITRLGETTLDRLSGYRVENGRAQAVAELP